MRGLSVSVVLSAALALAGCGSGPATPPAPAANTPSGGEVAVAPTSRPQDTAVFPVGTLILTQLSRPVAQTPGGQVIALTDDRFGTRGSPNGRYGVRFKAAANTFDLELVDYSTNPPTAKAIPDGTGFTGPGVTWKNDSSGFAFFDFPSTMPGGQTARTIFYYDLASGQTRRLISDVASGKIAASVRFSPDGKYLLYTVSDANAEGVGGPGSEAFLLDTTTNQSSPLPPESLIGFSQWLRDSSGFIALRGDPATGRNAVYVYSLGSLLAPKTLTPANASDLLIDTSPDGKWLVVSSSAGEDSAANIFIMGVDGASRRQITQFTDVEQNVTALEWGTDGIYYSLTGVDNQDTTWRMDLDGKNPTQLTTGTLQRLIGAG